MKTVFEPGASLHDLHAPTSAAAKSTSPNIDAATADENLEDAIPF